MYSRGAARRGVLQALLAHGVLGEVAVDGAHTMLMRPRAGPAAVQARVRPAPRAPRGPSRPRHAPPLAWDPPALRHTRPRFSSSVADSVIA